MENKQFNKDLASFISFSLKAKPTITFDGYYDKDGKFVKQQESVFLDDSDSLSEKELSTVEEIMDKYKVLKKYVPSNATLDKLKIVSNGEAPPKQGKVSEEGYVTVRINEKQFELAKTVARKTEEIYNLYKKEDFRLAKKSYNSLQDFLSKERAAFIGDFKSSRQVEDALGMYAVGANSDSINHPTSEEGCFVLIEIFLM